MTNSADPIASPSSEELKPCPFCGSEKINVDVEDEDNWNWIVQCDNKADVCPMIVQVINAFTRENAIAAWNRRASPVSDVPTCAQCGDDGPLQRCPSCGNDLCSTCITDPCDHAASRADVPSDPEQASCAWCGLPRREHRIGYGAHRCAFVGRSPGFENRCETTLNEGRHVCLLAKDHDGDCRPMVNAPWPPVPSGEARETMFRDVWDFAQRAYVLLDNLTDEEECRRDHHGACQTHLGEHDCSNARAIALLDQYSERFDEIEEALPLAASSPSPSILQKDTTDHE